MSHRFAAEHTKLVSRTDDLRRKDASSFSSREPELVDALEACLQGMRPMDAASREPLAKMADVSSPSAASCQYTEKKRPERASFSSPTTPPAASHDEFNLRRHAERTLRSSLRHASPEDAGRRQRRISWDTKPESFRIIPARHDSRQPFLPPHPGVELSANLESISHRCHLEDVAFVWELFKETNDLPLSCLQSGSSYLDFDFDATAAAFASASCAGVKLAMENRSKLRNP